MRTMPSARERNEFRRLFKADLSKYYAHPVLGFDVVKFDDEIVKSGTQSVRAAILQTWGPDAVRLIQDLLNVPAILRD